MTPVVCLSCHQTYSSKSQLDQHRELEHQMHVTVKVFDGSIKKINRDIITRMFTCPICYLQIKRPKSIQRHVHRDCRPKLNEVGAKRAIVINNDDSDTPELLRGVGLFVNPQPRMLLCFSCRYYVGQSARQVRSHITRLHSLGSNKIPSIEQLEGVLASLNLASEEYLSSYGTNGDKDVRPIHGLPIHNGEMCTMCKYMCSCKRTMKRHLKSHTAAHAKSVTLQTFSIGTKKRFFRVFQPVSEEATEFLCDALSGEIQKFHDFNGLVGSNDIGDNIISPLLRQFHWHKKLPKCTDCTSLELMNMCKISKDSSTDQNIYTAVSRFFERGVKMLDSTSYLIRRYVIAGGLNVSNDHRGLGYVNDASGTYRKHMTKLIHMATECAVMNNNHTPIWKFSTGNAVENAAVQLQEVCSRPCFDAGSDQVQSQVIAFLEALYVTESKAAVSKRKDEFELYSVYRYVVCSSIIGGELQRLNFLKANGITSICAAFVYWARLFVLVSVASLDLNGIDSTLYYIRDGVPTSFNALLEIMKLGKSLSGPTEGQNPIVHWTNDDMTSLVCKTATVTKDRLQAMASSVSTCIKTTFQQSLLLGFDTDSLRAQIESTSFVDDINSKADGCWFMTRPENQLAIGPQHLLAYFGSSSCKESLWSNEGVGSWNSRSVKKWLRDCDEFMDDMIIMMHLTFGQPARASELASFRIRDSHLEFRSIYAIRNRFTMIQVYHKSINVTGKFKPIARFAPMSLNADILLYFYLVRPVQAFLFDAVFSNPERLAQSYLDFVFVKTAKAMNPEQIRRSIAKGFAKFSEMKLDVSTYRHVAVALIDPHFRDQRLTDDLLDEQAGHSRQTASTVYARGDNDPSTLSRDQLHLFWLGSSKWQHFLGLTTATSPVQFERTNSINSTERVAKHDKSCLSKKMEQIASALSRVESQVQVLRTDASKCVPDQQLFPPVSPDAFASAKRVVARFTGLQTGSFRSIEQGIALSLLVSKPQQHRLIILPTGGGKSLLYMAHYIANPSSAMTSIIVVPTAALLNESVVKVKLHRISACRYTKDLNASGTRFSLVFAAVEHIGQDDFRQYLTLLKARGVLHTIFIDEAHLTVTALSYRPEMAYAPVLITFGAPLVLLSATVPIKMEKDLAIIFRTNFQTVRASTNRENISYNVSEVTDLANTAVIAMQQHQLILHGSRNRCIAYCATRREVDNMWQLYRSKSSLNASHFHAGMDSQQQAKAIAEWKNGKCVWMIATTAFGVGIDYPSVRVVLHVGSSWSLLDYAQETGRAGRDGASSLALTLTTRQYQHRLSKLANNYTRSDFCEMVKYLNDVNSCRRQHLQTAIDGYGFPCLASSSNKLCDVCNNLISDGDNLISDGGVNEETYYGRNRVETAARAANQQNASDRIIQGRICEFLDQLSPSSCPMCWVKDQHRPCRCLKGCYKCQYRDHISAQCPYKLLFYPGTCYLCGLPLLDLATCGRSMHQEKDYGQCTHSAKGFVIGAAWAEFHRDPPHGAPTDPKGFSQWLPKQAETSVFSNLIVLFYQLVKSHGSYHL